MPQKYEDRVLCLECFKNLSDLALKPYMIKRRSNFNFKDSIVFRIFQLRLSHRYDTKSTQFLHFGRYLYNHTIFRSFFFYQVYYSIQMLKVYWHLKNSLWSSVHINSKQERNLNIPRIFMLLWSFGCFCNKDFLCGATKMLVHSQSKSSLHKHSKWIATWISLYCLEWSHFLVKPFPFMRQTWCCFSQSNRVHHPLTCDKIIKGPKHAPGSSMLP